MNMRKAWGIVIAGFILIVAGTAALILLPPTANAPTDGVGGSSGQMVTERGNNDILRTISIKPGDTVTSPLVVTGEARGTWYFEASFPLSLVNWDGLIIAEVPAQAVLNPNDPNSTWMTEEYVPFKATLTFENPSWEADFSKRGALILQKDNPSGLPEHDDSLEIPVRFK